MTGVVMGMETEFGACRLDATAGSAAGVCAALMTVARERLEHLPHLSQGIFLASGARLYIDQGSHPEWCTAECATASDVVHQVRAGEAHLVTLLREVGRAALLRTNSDYVSGATWGSHESHLYRCDRALLSRILLPHVVARIIFTGAGGLDPNHPGIKFVISPRALSFQRQTGGPYALDSEREERLARKGFERYHITLGETLCADLPLWLRVATTALLVRVVDAGLLPDDAVLDLQNPTAALRSFSRDHTLRATARLHDGTPLTAVDVERRCLATVERVADRAGMPDWAPEACHAWGRVLEQLANGPQGVCTTCDWAIKREIMLAEAGRAGFVPEHIAHWNDVLGRLHSWRDAHRNDARRTRPRRCAWRVERQLGLLAPAIHANGVDADELAEFLALRQRLCEIDVRFGQLPDGLFASLEPQLDDRAPGVSREGTRRAMTTPPRGTRAAVRGRAIRELSEAEGTHTADWEHVIDHGNGRRIDLSNPLCQRRHWRPQVQRVPSSPDLWAAVSRLFNRGDFNRLAGAIDTALRGADDGPSQAVFLRYRALLESRTGHVAKAKRTLETRGRRADVDDDAVDRVSLYRFQGLTPPSRAVWHWINRCEQQDRDDWEPSTLASLLGHKGYALGRQGRLEEAVATLRDAVSIRLTAPNHLRITARNRCDLADCLRILGRRLAAARELDLAQRILVTHGHHGEWADAWAVTAAKRAASSTTALDLLQNARHVQQRLGNPIGVARSTLLIARCTPSARRRASCRRRLDDLRTRVPDLERCPLLASILDRWEGWTRDEEPITVHGDRFWMV